MFYPKSRVLKKTHRKKTQPKKTLIFKPADLPHFQNDDDNEPKRNR